MRSGLAVLAVTLVAAASTGCSSDDDNSPTPAGTAEVAATTAAATTAATTAETRPEPPEDQSRWARQIDRACRPWQARIDTVPPPADASALEQFLAETLPLARKQVTAVRAVKLPSKESEATQAALFVNGMRDLERSLTRYLAAIRAGDAVAMQEALAAANSAGVATRAYAASLGITQCGGYEGG